jgi:hypothetical protein
MINKSTKSFFLAAMCFVLMTVAASSVSAQTAEPELSIAGFRLGDEESAKNLLRSYSPRYDNERGQPEYFFYNNYGNQVLTVTAHSKERPHLIVRLEVFAVGESYQKKHYQLKEHNVFISESGFFIGARPSAKSLIFAVPNVTGTKNIIKKMGQPQADEKAGKVRTLRYEFGEVRKLEAREAKLKGVNFSSYTAEFRFYKNKLSRFSIGVSVAK